MIFVQENGWHVLLDASSLGAKDMETLGLSIFQPDFIICSFFKIFGENPSGFGCLFVKKSSTSVLIDSGTGIVSIVPKQDLPLAGPGSESAPDSDQASEIVEIDESTSGIPELECRGLDHADALGLIRISSRGRYLVNWLVNALISLHHPNSDSGPPLVRIYGPSVRIDRGPAVAFNIFDWKGERVDPKLVQKLADRNNISLSCAFLRNVWFQDRVEGEMEGILERENHREIEVITASLGFLTDFEDVYTVWAFVSRFLDADFVEKERWRYTALNQTTVEI